MEQLRDIIVTLWSFGEWESAAAVKEKDVTLFQFSMLIYTAIWLAIVMFWRSIIRLLYDRVRW